MNAKLDSTVTFRTGLFRRPAKSLRRGGDAVQTLANGLAEPFAVGRQRRSPRKPQEKEDTQLPFQQLDVMADGALGQPQFLARQREAQAPGDGLENHQAADGGKAGVARAYINLTNG